MATLAEILFDSYQKASTMQAEAAAGVPENSYDILKAFVPGSPEELAVDVAGGPALKGLGLAGAGVLKHIPWEKATARVPAFMPYSKELKELFARRMKLTGTSGNERALMGVLDPEKGLLTEGTEGVGGAVMKQHPRGWDPKSTNYEKEALLKPAKFDFHTHPSASASDKASLTGQSNAYMSKADWNIINKGGTPEKVKTGLWEHWEPTPGMRANQEVIVANPEKDYLWWSILQDLTKADLKPIRDTTVAQRFYEDEMMARLLYGAKKNQWDVQTSIDPRLFGVKP